MNTMSIWQRLNTALTLLIILLLVVILIHQRTRRSREQLDTGWTSIATARTSIERISLLSAQLKSPNDVAAAIEGVARELAHAIVRDGEGATKFIEVRVEEARSQAEAARVAYAVSHSPLVKTAFFASDPNLGRILAAVGYAGVDDLDTSLVQMHLDEVWVVRDGGRHPEYREEDGQRVMKQSEIVIRLQLGRGSEATSVWTTDLSHDYVSINADYRS